MRAKVGWIYIFGAIILFIINVFTLANQLIITAKWASTASTLIGFVVCPILLLVGVAILILGGKK